MVVYELREEDLDVLRMIHGKLFEDDSSLITWLDERTGPLVTIGDRVTLTLLSLGIVPDLAIIDMLERRIPIAEDHRRALEYGSRELTCDNPAGVVTQALWDAVSEGLRKPPARVVVSGEEDLAAIPVTMLAPLGSVVIYGMPGQGMVAYAINEGHKRAVSSLLAGRGSGDDHRPDEADREGHDDRSQHEPLEPPQDKTT